MNCRQVLPLEEPQASRVGRLQDELGHALSGLERATLKSWGKRSATRLLILAGRRMGGLAQLASLLGRAGGGELIGLFSATQDGRLMTHVGDRTAAAIDGTLSIGRDSLRLIAQVARNLLRNPKANAPVVLGALLGFEAGSGGLDGNGGIPDLDLLGGIGAHRSLLTHSIISGIVVEGLLLALADLAAEIHGKLPAAHDPIWDGLARIGRPLTNSLAIGTSAGLAYHLLVDALVQPAPYHGMPFGMPMESHQTIMAANGIAEGNDAWQRARKSGREVVFDVAPARTTGRKVVDAAAATSGTAADIIAHGYRTIARKWGFR